MFSLTPLADKLTAAGIRTPVFIRRQGIHMSVPVYAGVVRVELALYRSRLPRNLYNPPFNK